ncbi:sensor histidine kinase [Paludibacterium yongneupense]|uniref:sensor histidine kinase n=1 Tax=Paludibacterium yongneupense TaxID=400061 RepID=UPI001B7FE840|nr:ATP-binding protein [Paludibacterium yongneupense]
MKNSLGMLSGLLEKFLAEQSETVFSGYKDLSSMLYETRRINNDLMQLLALYKLDQNLYPFDPHPVAVSGFLGELAAQNARLLAARRITLICDCPDTLVGHFDEDLLQGAINQALNNASQYTRGQIRLAAAMVDGMLEIRVEDDGEGYPPCMLGDEAAQLGVDFNRGSTGLGLHFARSVAALHKNKGRCGSLRLENGGLLGGGCFILQLP